MGRPEGVWLPQRAKNARTETKPEFAIGIIGPSGAGKTHLIRQTAMDPRWADKTILVIMSENATSTLGSDIPDNVYLEEAHELREVRSVVDALVAAGNRGDRLPDLVLWDSASGSCDYERERIRVNPTLDKGGDRNTYKDYFDLGAGILSIMALARDKVKADFITLATTTYPPFPELCIDGKMTPKSFTRMTSVCVFLQSERGTFEKNRPLPEGLKLPHVTLGRDFEGNLDGTYVARFFTTQNTGEIPAKGHDNLYLTERAILPDVLAKLHAKGVVNS